MKKLILLCLLFSATVFALSSCDPIDSPDDNIPDEEKPVEDSLATKIVITTMNGQIAVDSDEQSVSLSYEILNPKEDGTVIVEIPETNDWISNPVIDVDAKTITMDLAKNQTPGSRSEIITVRYKYGEESVVAVANIIQTETVYDYVVNCTYSISKFYGQGMAEDMNLQCYYLRMGTVNFNVNTREPKTWIYSFDFYLDEVTENKLPASGTYKFVTSGEETDFTFSDFGTSATYYGEDLVDYTDYMKLNFYEGTVTVEQEGDEYTMVAILTDMDGKLHYVSYKGVPEMKDVTVLSTLEGNIEMELKNYDIVASDYDDFYGEGMRNWRFEIYGDLYIGDYILVLDVLTPMDVTEFTETILFDSYYAEPTEATSFYLPGQAEQQLSWLVTYHGDGVDFGDPSAAILYGTILLEAKDNGKFKMTTDVYDQLGNSIKLTMDDMEFYYYDMAPSASPMQKSSIFNRGVDFAGLASRVRK